MCYIDSDFVQWFIIFMSEERVHILAKKCLLVWFLRLMCGSLRVAKDERRRQTSTQRARRMGVVIS